MEAGRAADLVFYMIPPDMDSYEVKEGLKELSEDIGGDRITAVFSKSDEGKNPEEKDIIEVLEGLGIKRSISVSAEEELNIDKLEDVITTYYESLGGGQSEPSVPKVKRCPNCGFNTTDPEVVFCIECGTRLI